MTTDQRDPWGLIEGLLAWPAAVFAGTLSYVVVLQAGGFSPFVAERPGGHLGRSFGQLVQGEVLRNDSIPLVWQLFLLVPGWLVLLGVSWTFAGALRHDRVGWSLKGELADVPLGMFSGLFLQLPLLVIVALLIQLVFGEIEPSGRALALVDTADSWPKVAMLVLFVAVGAPVVEELFYRGVLQPWFVGRVGPVLGIAASSAIFGAVHLSVIEFFPLTVVGLVLGYLFWKTGRLLPAVIAHMTFNLFTLVNLLAASRSA